jgi:hypothetical protein
MLVRTPETQTMSTESPTIEPQAAARQLLKNTEQTRDALPYTDEFERLYAEFARLTQAAHSRHQFWRLLSSVAKKGGWKGRKRGEAAPDLTLQQADTLRRLVAGRLGSRDGLPYSDTFDRLKGQFNAATGLALTDRQFWRAVCHLGKQPLRPDVDGLLTQAFDSLTLAVDQFNRSAEQGRRASVLIFLDHACELLLKAALLQRGVGIRDQDSGYTFSLETCLNKATDDGQVKFLSDDERATLRVLNGLRDQAQHYLVDVSEQVLYTVAQSTLTLFGDLTARLFGVPLGERLPRRVLPLSTDPPRSIHVVMDEEFSQLKKLMARRLDAEVASEPKLRSLLAMDRALEGKDIHVAAGELHAAREAVRGSAAWDEVFKGIARLNMTTDGSGIGLALTISKHEGIPVRIAAEGEEAAGVVAIRKVDDTSFYCFGLHELAKRLKVGAGRLLALIRHLDIQADRTCYKEIAIGKAKFKMYSQNALQRLREALPTVNLDEVWRKHGARRRKKG